MAKGGGGGGGGDARRAAAPPGAPPCPPELKGFFSCLVMLLRQMDARNRAFASEQERLVAEIEFLKREQRQRLEIAQDSIQEIRRGASLKDEMAELLERKELAARGLDFDVLGDTCLESFKSWISTLANENTELKKKLKDVESEAELTENTVDHQHSAKGSRADVRKLKKAYKTMVLEKEKEISAIHAESGFVWNQLKSLEKEFRDVCTSKNIEIKQANQAAEQLKKTVHELRLEVQEKDGEIGRLKAEVVSTKENMLMIQTELEQLRSLVKKSKDAEAISHATPVRRKVKTSRKGVSSAKERRKQSGTNSRMHNMEDRQFETSQKRKRGSSTLSSGLRRCSARLQVRPTASPGLFTPSFTIPKLTAPSPSLLY